MKRKKFIQTTTLASMGTLLMPKIAFPKSDENKQIAIGFIGTGLRGQWLLDLAAKRSDVKIPAICDIDNGMIQIALDILKNNGKDKPVIYNKGDEDFRNLLNRDDLDGVIIATPWEWHAEMSISAMNAGKHVGSEVPAALTVKDCWSIVNASEKNDKFCMLMENVCYRRDVMAILNMVRKGMFGELLHLQGGYQHDLRDVKFNDGTQPYGGGVEFGEKGYSEAKWRTEHSIKRNGDLYPTHGVGPISTMLDINRGNRFMHITSTATQARGLHRYIVKKGGKNHPNAKINFKLGDIVTSVIKCANGQTVMLNHDTSSPRPYSLNFRVQGTNGIWMRDNNSIYLENMSPKPHSWESFDRYQKEYDHELWKAFSNDAKGAGHGGIDFFIMRAFIESIKRNISPPIDVYDAVSMSVICPLSEKSIAQGSRPIRFPDFTRGKWKKNKPIFGLNKEF